MRETSRWLIILIAGATAMLVGCTASMMNDPAAMRGHIQDARVENQAHLDAALAATSMPAMMDEMNRHGPRMEAMMDTMGGTMDAMMGCTGAGMQHMMAMRGEMMDEMDDHETAVADAAQLEAARTEVGRHVAAMVDMLDQMGTALDDAQCGGMGGMH